MELEHWILFTTPTFFPLFTHPNTFTSNLRGILWGFLLLLFPSCRLLQFLFLSPSRVLIKKVLESTFPEILSGSFHTIWMYWVAVVVFKKVDKRNIGFENAKITLCFICGSYWCKDTCMLLYNGQIWILSKIFLLEG